MAQTQAAVNCPSQPASRRPAGPALSYLRIYKADPIERIGMIKDGILASEAKRILSGLSVSQAAVMRALNISPAPMNRKAKGEDRLPPAESERILAIARLIGHVQAI